MNTQEIKEKLQSQEYDFLRTDKHLGDNIILLTTGGSHSYGTNIDTSEHTSDLDIRGIAIENINEIIGLSNFEQFINEETDTTIYGLRKVLNLMLNCNPNVIEMLGTKEDHLFICNKYGQLLRDNVDLFLSKKAINSFGGYARQQLKRANNNMINLTKDKELKARKNVMHLIRLLIMGTEILEEKGINTYREKDKQLFLDIRNGIYTFDEIYNMAENLEVNFKYASDNTNLPENPNFKRVEELIMNIYMEVLNGENK
jgi:predicted nucleotidyltransferase